MSTFIPSFLMNSQRRFLWKMDRSESLENLQLFNVGIYSARNHYENDIDDISKMDTCKCNICNVDVPKQFMDEHIISSKHKSNLKIMETALQRMQSQIKYNSTPPTLTIEMNETHFCEHCVITVLNKDKEKHTLSEKHLNSVNNDRLLEKLVLIYEEPQTGSTNTQIIDIIGTQFEDDKRTQTKNTPKDSDMKKYTKTQLKEEPNGAVTCISPHQIDVRSNSYYEPLIDNIDYFKTFIKGLNARPYNHNRVIVMQNEREVKIPLQNFHGYKVVGKNVVCNICAQLQCINGRMHKKTKSHVMKINAPLKDGFLRQIDDTMDHCLLCNSIQPSTQSALHRLGNIHKINLKKYTVEDVITEKIALLADINLMTLTDDKAHCSICQIDIPKTNEAIHTHLQSFQHLKKKHKLADK